MIIKLMIDNNHLLNIKLILFTTIIGLLNSFFYDNFLIMFVLAIAEVISLLFCFVKKDYLHYLCLYMIFLSFSMESSTFVGTEIFYGFKNFRIMGLNLAVWMLLPLLCQTILDYKIFTKRMGRNQQKILILLTVFTICGFLMGILTYLSGDNGFIYAQNSFSIFFDVNYTYILPFIEIIIAMYIVLKYSKKIYILKRYMFASIISTAIVFTICFFTKNYGNRGGLNSLQVSSLYFLLVNSLVLTIYNDFTKGEKVLLIISSLIILILSLMYNTSGKIVISAILIPIIMLLIIIKKGLTVNGIIKIILVLILLIGICVILFPYIMSVSQLFTIKFQQVIDLFSFGENWLTDMAASPKMRITEFMNISSEFLKKPYFFVFGKGFCGTIKDNLHLFNNIDSFTFSEWELQLGAYYTMHESINCFYLVGGILGLYVLFSICILLLKNINKSPWLVFGFAWILLFYNYHMSIAIFGIIALMVGLQDIETI